jgi:hypothetical protein
MAEALIIRPLRCGHCGGELPVMGQLVTFQCPACLRYWVISHDALAPITVHRAVSESPGESASNASALIYLPFWVADVDGAGLRREIDSGAGTAPPTSEIKYLFERLESLGVLRVYIPAFRSLNTYAYLKVGRLLTRIQPSFALERSEGTGHAILCALRAEEAVALMDFIFFATLPGSIQSNGAFLEKIHLRPARPPRLVEFPFRERGASLVSIIGGFWISGKLVEGIESLVE